MLMTPSSHDPTDTVTADVELSGPDWQLKATLS
jgi:hypothetical protein